VPLGLSEDMKKVLWLTFVIGAGLYITDQVKDPDLWWHITVGRWILAHLSLPHQDYWTMFASGEPWKAYSWSVEILFALVDRHWGIHGLFVLQCVFGVILSLSLAYVFGMIAKDHFFGALLGVYATASTFNHFTLRPQVLVWIYFAYLLLVSERINRDGLKTGYKARLILLMCLWANTHISSILGVTAVFLWTWRRDKYGVAFLSALYAFIGTLITPYLGGEWIMFAQTASHPFSHQSINEFVPANITQYSTAFLVILVPVLASFFHRRAELFDGAKLLLVGLFLIGALAVVKFLPFAVIVICAVLALFWQRQASQPSARDNLSEGFRRLDLFVNKIPKEGLSFVLICLSLVKVYGLWQEPLDKVVTPEAALDFMQSNNLPHPILNTFGNGGYVMYRYSGIDGELPHKVPIDGRTNLISDQLWATFNLTLNGRMGWQKFIEMVKPATILWKTESPLIPILLEGGKWCLVFESGSSGQGYTVFVKRAEYERQFSALRSVNCMASSMGRDGSPSRPL
jgi:hypothetical protein